MADMSLPIDTTCDQPSPAGDEPPAFSSLEAARSYLAGVAGTLLDRSLHDAEMLVASAAELASRLDQRERSDRALDFLLDRAESALAMVKNEVALMGEAVVVVMNGDPAQLCAQAIREARFAAIKAGPTYGEHQAVERLKGRIAELVPVEDGDAEAWARLKAEIAKLAA